MNFPLASLARPPARHPPVAGFRSPSFGPPCIHEAYFRHRGAPVSDSLSPSATVAACIPDRLRRSGGRHRFRQASSPPVQARRFAATFPVSFPPAFIHARRTVCSISFCPINRRQPARLSSSPIRITPLLFATPTNCKKKQPPRR